MKKLLSILLAMTLVLSMAACGGNGGSSAPAPSTPAGMFTAIPRSSTPTKATPSTTDD